MNYSLYLQRKTKQNSVLNNHKILIWEMPTLCWHCVLVLVGIELIFFLLSGMALCFRFMMRIMLIAHQRSSCCTAVLIQSQASHVAPKQRTGGAAGAGRGHNQDSWPRLSKGMSCDMQHHVQQ